MQKLAESFNGKSKPKTDQAKENNCIAQEEVEEEGDGAKKKKLAQTTIKWHTMQLAVVARCALRLVRELCGKFGVLQNVLIRNRITRHAAI